MRYAEIALLPALTYGELVNLNVFKIYYFGQSTNIQGFSITLENEETVD